MLKKAEHESAITLIAGDLNSKIGKRQEPEIRSDGFIEIGDKCLGRYSRNVRNENGNALIEFCEENDLFIANSAFKHSARHQTTWASTRTTQDGRVIRIFNQIDFIICQQRDRNIFQDARSYAGTKVSSDHRIVVGRMIIKWQHIMRRRPHNQEPRININKLRIDNETREKYRRILTESSNDNNNNNIEDRSITPQEKWDKIRSAIQKAGLESAGTLEKPKHPNREPDKEINDLCIKQKELRLQIENTTDITKRQQLKRERNRIQHKISNKALSLRNQELDKQVEEIEKNSDDATMMYKAVKTLNRKKFENPKVEDETGKLAATPNEILEITTKFFKSKFREEQTQDIEPFEGQPRRLQRKITSKEIEDSFKSLNNNRAAGGDDIVGELLKYGSKELSPEIAEMLNQTFETHQPLNINNGNMITLQKPGKPKGPVKNLRPVTLLDTIRKSLSLTVLQRIRPKVEKYLSPNQSGFRPSRSTADVVWTHKWLAAKIQKQRMKLKLTGIDMSAAFDTVDRQKLLNILESIVDEDELRMIRFLLSNTTINIKVNGATEQHPFLSNIGIPQGDGLSPVLFIIYLEAALREVRKRQAEINTPEHNYAQQAKINLPKEIAYADDVDFISLNQHEDIAEIQNILAQYNLQVNREKTEYTNLERKNNTQEEEWRTTKKVGSLIGDVEDIARRKSLSNIALNKLYTVWIRKDKLILSTRLRLYKTLVKPILLYNCGTWGITKNETEKLDAFHRKHLRRLLGIRWPTKITNDSLYKKTNERPISTTLREARWKLFGHILRRDPATPANMAMNFYFEKNNKGFRGKPRTTLPTVLNQDLENYYQNTEPGPNMDHNYSKRLKLNTPEDLEKLRKIAENRKEWKKLVHGITNTREATSSVDDSAAPL